MIAIRITRVAAVATTSTAVVIRARSIAATSAPVRRLHILALEVVNRRLDLVQIVDIVRVGQQHFVEIRLFVERDVMLAQETQT